MIAIGNFTRSSSFRVGALLTSLAVAAIIFIVYFWRIASSDVFLREAKAAVNAEAYAYAMVYEYQGVEGVVRAMSERGLAQWSISDDTIVALQASSGELLGGNVTSWPYIESVQTMGNDGQNDTQTALITATPIIDVANPPHSSPLPFTHKVLFKRIQLGNNRLFIGRNIHDLYSAQWLGKTFSWVIVVLLSVLGMISFAVASYVVKRINRMSQTADNIIRTGSLQERLEIDSNWDDLSRLSVVFNQMLDTIENSVNNIKSVSDSIAHDLRTPLARLRNSLQKIDDPSLRDDTIAEADNLLNMFNSLLRISGLESARKKEGFCTVSLKDITVDVIDLYHPFAEEHHLKLIDQLTEVSLFADPNLLFQAIANVLDNAVKYTPSGGTVTVQLTCTPSRIALLINDNGPGVKADDIPHLERRFFRADDSRSTQGNGLGLSLVSAIVSMHDGHLWFIHDPMMQGHGLGVVFSFPRSSGS